MSKKLLSMDTVNPLVRDMVDGEVSPTVKRCLQIERELRKGIMKPFTEVIRGDINDPQAISEEPITFIRQVITACAYPLLLSDPFIPIDVKARANLILDKCGGRSPGAYTYSEGIGLIREHVAQYMSRRDGYPANPENIILSSGHNEALRSLLNVINSSTKDEKIGILAPVPRDPLLTSMIDEMGIVQIDYYLDEDDEWSINPEELSVAVEEARPYCTARAILVVNPGNPTGSILSPENMEEIIRFAAKRKLVLLADEAYQFNSFAQGCQFHSFKKILMQMGPPYTSLELISTISGSTCILGENGLHWGCSELLNIKTDVYNVYMKSICVKMCPGVLGQIALDCMIFPPQPPEPSHEQFIQEWTSIMQSVNERSRILIKSLNEIEGFECSPQTAASFVFAKIHLPAKAIEEAKRKVQSPDTFYALNLLEESGICTQPGILFGQLPGTYHLRISILPSKEKIREMVEIIRQFNTFFLLRYS